MARLSISEAARQAGISRQYLHTRYIKRGVLTAFTDETGKPYVESADLLRVFEGRLPGPKTSGAQVTGVASNDTAVSLQQMTPDIVGRTAQLQAELTAAHEQLQEAREREKWYQAQLESLTGTLRQLEHRPGSRRGWLSRMFGGGE